MSFFGVDTSNSTEFFADGIKYGMSSYLFSMNQEDPSDVKKMKVDYVQPFVVHFEWTNEINDLCLKGFVDFEDTNGIIGNYVSAPFTFFAIDLNKLETKKDGSIETSVPSDSVKPFQHLFIVDKVVPLGRVENIFKYRFELKSILWTRLISIIPFSNCINDPGMDLPEPTNIFEILKKVIGSAIEGLQIPVKDENPDVKVSFESVKSITDDSYHGNPPKLRNYITYANDRVFDVIRTIQAKSLVSKNVSGNLIDALWYVMYDEFDNQIKFVDLKFRQMHNSVKVDPKENVGTIISKSSEGIENFMFSKQQFFQKTSKSTFAERLMHLFGIKRNNYKDRQFSDVEIKMNNTVGITSEIDKTSKSMAYSTPDGFGKNKVPVEDEKFRKNIFNVMFPIANSKRQYSEQTSESNDDDAMYNKLMYDYKNNDVVSFVTHGAIDHRPGMFFTIRFQESTFILDSVPEKSQVDSSLDQIFHVISVKHIIEPRALAEYQGTFQTQLNMVSRNYIEE